MSSFSQKLQLNIKQMVNEHYANNAGTSIWCCLCHVDMKSYRHMPFSRMSLISFLTCAIIESALPNGPINRIFA